MFVGSSLYLSLHLNIQDKKQRVYNYCALGVLDLNPGHTLFSVMLSTLLQYLKKLEKHI